LNLAGNIKGNKNGFYKYVNSKMNTRENEGLLLNASGKLLTKYMSKARILNVSFHSAGKISLQEP